MALTLNLTPEIEQYLTQRATEQGLSLESYALKLLTDTILLQEKKSNWLIFFCLGSMKKMRKNNKKQVNIYLRYSIKIVYLIVLYFRQN